MAAGDERRAPSTQDLVGGPDLRGCAHHLVEDRQRDRGEWVTEADLPNGVRVHVVTAPLEVARPLLADPRLSKDSAKLTAVQQRQLVARDLPPDVNGMFARTVLNSDGLDHQRLRGLVAGEFTARRVRALRPRIEQVAAELVAGLPVGEPVDLVTRLATPLPLTVVNEMLGVPARDAARLSEWTDALLAGRPELNLPATRRLRGYLAELIDHKRDHPDDGLLSALVAVSLDGDRLSPDELVGTALLLIVAGHETTANVIGNAIALLLAHRDEPGGWRWLAAHPDHVDQVVEEVSRVDPGVRNAPHRFAEVDLDVGGSTIPAGAIVLVNLGSAGRDPAVHGDDARSFAPGRETRAQHVAFGHGPHYCIGARLARLEVGTVLREVTSRYPGSYAVGDRTDVLDRFPRRQSPIMNPYRAVEAVLVA
ncbi:cytochrome P450 [Actinosynnema sp. CS-041913]|uniref:cytochrome P450 n=1 Tax=Actinosynnema sp. CS-041913 TaxID=3239917 RepID=UPI003D942920